jgi:HSP20 family protein
MRDKIRHKSIFFLSHTVEVGQNVWVPHVDVYRKSRNWLIKCDLAGVRREDLTVSTRNSHVMISGVRRDPLAERGWEHYSMEIPYSRFACSVSLPHHLDEARVETEYLDGMLLVRVHFDE